MSRGDTQLLDRGVLMGKPLETIVGFALLALAMAGAC
jgi:hypothetical protein